ncbi:hypothetical protein HOLleu_40182 [Holothuria leucospilota]|uniref:Uncharacterized protein n=1 Tax=Holothuria leucospilota TaxID=206669 RepID=A0A9Q0YCZ9_HOLLE|nr:hypothetical protein HOLleu_40182 [Holothuria leucospilota]
MERGRSSPQVHYSKMHSSEMIQEIDSDDTKTPSHHSGSNRSKASSVAVQARAKAQALKAQLEYVKREAALRKQEAELANALLLLGAEKDYVMAETEAEVLEAAASEDERSILSLKFSLPKSDPKHRTSEYVSHHFGETPTILNFGETSQPVNDGMQDPKHTISDRGQSNDNHRKESTGDSFTKQPPPGEGPPLQHPQDPGKNAIPDNHTINDQVQSNDNNHTKEDTGGSLTKQLSPGGGPPLQNPTDPGKNAPPDIRTIEKTSVESVIDASSFGNILMKKELVKSSIRSFKGNPGEYRGWKESFKQATKELDLSPIQEVNIIISNVDGDTKSLIKRISDIHVSDPSLGLQRIWAYLDKRHGAKEAVEKELMNKLEDFPRISKNDSKRLEDYGYLLMEVQYVKETKQYPGLLVLDSSRGVQPLVEKLPEWIQKRWRDKGYLYKESHSVSFPPFGVFVEFVQGQARVLNDPSFAPVQAKTIKGDSSHKSAVTVRKTEVKDADKMAKCPIHKTAHSLQDCRSFREKPIEERTTLVKDNHLCFKCLLPGHLARNCKSAVKCETCGKTHLSIMHKPTPNNQEPTPVTTNCTKVCGSNSYGRSCAKICLAKVYTSERPNDAVLTYVLIDDQSDGSLVDRKLLDQLKVNGGTSRYAVQTVNGLQELEGRKVSGLQIGSSDGKFVATAPTLFECNHIPGSKTEIPTPEVAAAFDHLTEIAPKIPPLQNGAEISVLLGRDAAHFHKIREVINGDDDQPWAHRLDLGWVVIGEVCLSGAHVRSNLQRPEKKTVTTLFTQVLKKGRPSIQFQSCANMVKVMEGRKFEGNTIGQDVFLTTCMDEQIGPSCDEREFSQLMAEEMVKDGNGNWCAPLPFRKERPQLPNNKSQAERRLRSLVNSLDRNERKKGHYFEFMEKIFKDGHAERVPEDQDRSDGSTEVWYLPHFGVYHPRKPTKIRVVFDSSAVFSGISLNEVLLSGPDLLNDLLGVLIRFREEPVAVTADIKQMFYAFKVKEDHRRYLRFLWFEDNKPDKQIVTYQMTVHIFGNKPSPAVAITGLRKTGEEGEMLYGRGIRDVIEQNFYMDDLLVSLPTVREAIEVIKKTRELLSTANIHIHKFSSNNSDVLAAFEPNELAPDLISSDLEEFTVQRTLGVCWNLESDYFTFQLSDSDPDCCTRRKILSEVNGVFDPIGFASPVIIKGKMLLRDLIKGGVDWDQTLSGALLLEWKRWRDSLSALTEVQIPRPLASFPSSQAARRELHTFGDASNQAIGAVCYLRTVGDNDEIHVRLVLGKAKLAPKAATTIPRLELCASVLATEVATYVSQELQLSVDQSWFYTDSRVVLGYIRNRRRRFRTYVCNRVNQILQSTQSDQWLYIPSERNPADQASRSIPASDLKDSLWLNGPSFLSEGAPLSNDNEVEIVPDDPEVLQDQIQCHKTMISQAQLDTDTFSRFSSWKSLIRAIVNLIHVAKSFKNETTCTGWHICKDIRSTEETLQAETIIIRSSQSEVFATELDEISCGKLTTGNRLASLNPYLDSSGILRVGGRLQHADLPERTTHPCILPRNHHVTNLIIEHFHHQCFHQGRHITLGVLRNEGYWVIGGQRQVSRVIQNCVTCKRLRGRTQQQIMANLPTERVTEAPPFTFVGVDVFGPFLINNRRTRASFSTPKRWAVLFTCMATRGVHIEVLEAMDSSSFINALRRFFAIRGPAKQIRSDCGSNFVGACNELGQLLVEKDLVKRYLLNHGCEWVFNPPHASSMGGAWERMIGIARRTLDGVLRDTKPSQITHEVFVTLMAEVAAIINARPLLPVSDSPELPSNLSPNMLLTMKSSQVTAPEGPFNQKDLLRSQWRRVQHLANMFWNKWRRDYLPMLQTRSKWQHPRKEIQVGDVVLIKKEVSRNEWPLGRVTEIAESKDGHVRKVKVEVVAEDRATLSRIPIDKIAKKTILRPIRELILLN